MRETRVSGETVFTGPVFHVDSDRVSLPDGKTGRRDVVRSNGGVVILPVSADGTITLVRQYRYAHEQILLEAVAGKLEEGEDPFPAAQRELKEETGFTAEKWTPLGSLITSPGYTNEVLWLFLAENLTAGEAEPDDGEFLQTVTVPLAEALGMLADGTLQDAKTIAILARACLAPPKR